jgi:hypothetical protein
MPSCRRFLRQASGEASGAGAHAGLSPPEPRENLRKASSQMKIKRIHILLVLLVVVLCVLTFRAHLCQPVVAATQLIKGKHTIADRVAQYGEIVRRRLTPAFDRINVTYPPRRVSIIGFKAERRVEVWVSGGDGEWKHLKDYPILGMSGTLSPKLKEGDMQVPEGIYRIESLNPNSLYHLALRVNYPNQEDRRRAKEDGRTKLGSDIMIHGKDCSIGCLAMGDEAAEDLFVLAAKTGIDNVSVILSPVDFRVRTLPSDIPSAPQWSGELYTSIKKALMTMKMPTTGSSVP